MLLYVMITCEQEQDWVPFTPLPRRAMGTSNQILVMKGSPVWSWHRCIESKACRESQSLPAALSLYA